jgi:di/tricarboxylate transporter
MAAVVTVANLRLLVVLAITVAVGYAAWENRPRRGSKTLAGFMLAEALQHHAIDRRLALVLIVRFGTSVRGLVLGAMVATALLSMVVSNTATVAMMVPVVLGIVFGAGYLRRDHMLRAGSLLDGLVILLTVGVALVLVRFVWPVVLG